MAQATATGAEGQHLLPTVVIGGPISATLLPPLVLLVRFVDGPAKGHEVDAQRLG